MGIELSFCAKSRWRVWASEIVISSAGLEQALGVGFRFEGCDLVKQGFSGMAHVSRGQVGWLAGVLGPHLLQQGFDNAGELLPGVLRLWAVPIQDAVEEHHVGGHLLDGRALVVVSPLGGGDQQAQDQRGERRDEGQPLLHGIFGLPAQMMSRQNTPDQHPDQRAGQHASERDTGNGE